MGANVGRIDSCVRGVLAIAFLIAAAVFHEFVLLSLGALLLALLLGGTAMTHNCPLYALFHLSTATDRAQSRHL
jgi:hypothetical protein